MSQTRSDWAGGLPVEEPSRPVTLRLFLGRILHRHREHSGVTLAAADRTLARNGAGVKGIELGDLANLLEVIELCDLYGVNDHEERVRMLKLARRAQAPAWWEAFSDIIPPLTRPYLGLEQDIAEQLWVFNPKLVPTLLQTPDYARALIKRTHPHADEATVNYHLTLVLSRQKRLRAGKITMIAIIGTPAFTWLDPRVAYRQLEALTDWNEHGTVTIHILPADEPAPPGPIAVLSAGEPPDLPHLADTPTLFWPDVVYKPTAPDPYLDTPTHVTSSLAAFSALTRRAQPLTSQTLAELCREL